MNEEWGICLASLSASAGPSRKKIKTEKEDEPSIAPALNPLSTSSVIPSIEVALSDEEDYSDLEGRKKIQF